MAPLPKTSINHFSHEGHPLEPVESDKEFLCNGCKTLGTGKRYRCDGCDFDLHDYCGTCPLLLTSFMHPRHNLTLETPQTKRFCDVCRDSVEGLFYRCKDCGFDVHPVCTQFPENFNHALHKIHPLTLQSSPVPNMCGVCRNPCNYWRYRCSVCNFDIHLECLLAPAASCPQTGQRGTPMPGQGVPYQPPPQYGFNYNGPGYPNHYGGQYMHPQQNAYHYTYPQQNAYPYGGQYMYPQQNFVNNQVGTSNNIRKRSMFALVGQLGTGVLSSMIVGEWM